MAYFFRGDAARYWTNSRASGARYVGRDGASWETHARDEAAVVKSTVHSIAHTAAVHNSAAIGYTTILTVTNTLVFDSDALNDLRPAHTQPADTDSGVNLVARLCVCRVVARVAHSFCVASQ